MLEAARNRMIALGFNLWTWSLRVKRTLTSLGQPRLRSFDHITLPVRDLAEAQRFYCEVLGAVHLMTIDEATLKKAGHPAAENNGEGTYHVSLLLGGRTRLDLFFQGFGQPALTQRHPHLAFLVPPGDMRKWKQRLESHGIPTEGPLQLGFPGQASLYFNDPSGNHLEVVCYGFKEKIPVRPPLMTGLAWDPAQPR